MSSSAISHLADICACALPTCSPQSTCASGFTTCDHAACTIQRSNQGPASSQCGITFMHAGHPGRPVLTGTLYGAGIALRVPTPNVSVVDLVIQVEKKTLAEEVNEAFRQVRCLAMTQKHEEIAACADAE